MASRGGDRAVGMPTSASASAVMHAYRAHKASMRKHVMHKYRILGFLNSGTYGRVYKAEEWRRTDPSAPRVYAIKKFKLDKEDDVTTFRGISQSAIREIALNKELQHENIVWLREVMLEDNSIFLVYEFVDHDFLQIIHHHLTVLRTSISGAVIKSLMWQLLNGIKYLHENWVMHRDLKPANILMNARGVVKIGDLGLARLYADPLISLYTSDMVVVTIWYRAPELLLGARHYTPAIDLWATGCIWGELMALRPMFKGEEARMNPKTKVIPLQSNQLGKIVDVLGMPTADRWPKINAMPDYAAWIATRRAEMVPKMLYQWYIDRSGTSSGFDLFDKLLQYDPDRRITAAEALQHPWFSEAPLPQSIIFPHKSPYPPGRVVPNDTQSIVPSRTRRPRA